MYSLWNAPSDLDYYGQQDEPEEEELETEPEPPDENFGEHQ